MSNRNRTAPSRLTYLALFFLLSWGTRAVATNIAVQFDNPGNPLPLRLNQASNGWTHSRWSQYYNDIGVQYRRMDHWNDAYAVVRRRPDGGLWYDYAALDDAIRDATGGFSFKAYATVDFCPACLDTDFLQNPMRLQTGTAHASMTPVGTMIISGEKRTPEPSMGMLAGAIDEGGMYEVDRKGIVIGRYSMEKNFFATAANHIVINKADGSYSILGADRKEMAHGTGVVLQEIDGTSLLLATGPASAQKISQVDLKGAVLQTWDGTFAGPVLLVKAGLVSTDNQDLFLNDKSGKRSIQKLPPLQGIMFSANPQDSAGTFMAATANHISGDTTGAKDSFTIFAFTPDGQALWKTEMPHNQNLRGFAATRQGMAIVANADAVFGVDRTGILWKAPGRGGLDLQLLSSNGMETVAMRTYEDEVDEYDVMTGDFTWRYGTYEDQTYWIRNPPQDMDGWADQLRHYLTHFNKDLGVGWDRWECWNEPTDHGYFWNGNAQDYATMVVASMKVVQDTDPSILMDAFDGGGGAWWSVVIKACNDNKVRLDGLSWHGYRNGIADYDALEKSDVGGRMAAWKAYTAGKTPQLTNTEWNLHPGQGEDLSANYQSGYYHAPFQAEMTYLMGTGGVTFSSEFSMVSGYTWPCGWVEAATTPVDGQTPTPGSPTYIVTPAYNGARLWAMLPQNEAPVTNDFVPEMVSGTASHVNAVATSDPAKGEYGLLVWNFSNQSTAAKDEMVNLSLKFKGESQLHMRHYVIDVDHSTYTKDWNHRLLEAIESVAKSASDLQTQTVTLKKDSLHAFFFTRDPLKANAGPSITVEAHHPVQFDGSKSAGIPAFYRWDVDAADGVDFPEPEAGLPSRSHLFGMKPVLVRGYDKPGDYTVTLRVATDGYAKETDTATVKVTVLPEKTAPQAPQNLTANSAKTDHQVFLQWDGLNLQQNPDVTGYVIYRKDGTADWKKLATTLPATSYVDSGVQEKVPYSYRVTAIDSSGNEGAPSAAVACTFAVNHKAPPNPISLKGVIVVADTVKLDWDNPSLAEGASVTGYNVYRRVKGSGDWQKLTASPTWYKRYYDLVTNTGEAGNYEYCVTALDVFKNESLQSDPASPTVK